MIGRAGTRRGTRREPCASQLVLLPFVLPKLCFPPYLCFPPCAFHLVFSHLVLPPVFIGVTVENPGSVVVAFPSPWCSPCAVGGQDRFPGLGRWMCRGPRGFRAALCKRGGHRPLITRAKSGAQPFPEGCRGTNPHKRRRGNQHT